MKKKIEKAIRQEIEYLLADIDIDAQIERIVSGGKIRDMAKGEIDNQIAKQVSDKIRMSIDKALTKNMPIIDAYTYDKVRSLVYEIDKITNPK